MTDLDLEAIKARVNACPDGPWEIIEIDSGMKVVGPEQDILEDGQLFGEEVLVFLAHARADIPALVAEIDRLRARLTITDDMVERAALAIAGVEQWPSNEDLGGNFFTGTRDDEFRYQYIDMARSALEAALGEDDA